MKTILTMLAVGLLLFELTACGSTRATLTFSTAENEPLVSASADVDPGMKKLIGQACELLTLDFCTPAPKQAPSTGSGPAAEEAK